MAVDVVFWYVEETVNKAWFTAENKEKGEELLRQLNEGEISVEDLPNYFSKNKGYELTLDTPEFYPVNEKEEASK